MEEADRLIRRYANTTYDNHHHQILILKLINLIQMDFLSIVFLCQANYRNSQYIEREGDWQWYSHSQVTNTPWGERVELLFNPNSETVDKPLHVSPFMDMLGSWSIRTNVPGDNLVVNISVKHPKLGDYFTASLTAHRLSSSSVEHALFFWLMPHKVALWIYWHALKLWWKKVVKTDHVYKSAMLIPWFAFLLLRYGGVQPADLATGTVLELSRANKIVILLAYMSTAGFWDSFQSY